MKIPILIDTDPGVDDAIAIFLANSSKKLDIRAITSVGGNVAGEKTFNNAVGLAYFLELNTRIARGSDKAFIVRHEDASWVHGETGMGKLSLPLPDQLQQDEYAWDVIYEEAIKANGELVILPIGPLTNIAIAILKYPNIKKYIKEIRLMGGSATYGNHSPYGEFNIWGDPHAADIVFKSGIPITMVGLNTTTKATLTDSDIATIKSIECKIQTPMIKLFDQMDWLGETFGFTDRVIHDAVVIGSLIDEELIETVPFYVSIETRSDINMGRTIVDFNNCSGKLPNVNVAMQVNRESFIKLLVEMMKTYSKGEIR